MDDDKRDVLAALDWINRQINGFDGGDRAAVVRRLLAGDLNIARGVAEVLKIGLVCHPDCPEETRGRKPKDMDAKEVERICTIGPYLEGAKKEHRARRIAEMQKRFDIKSPQTIRDYWAEWKRLQNSKETSELSEDYSLEE